MWTMTANGGFLSAVQHDEDPDLLVVRSRVKADALTLAQYLVLYRHLASEPRDMLITYATSDYPWRVIVPRDVFASFLAAQVAAIDYGNFKAAVGLISPEHAHAYARVWADLLVLERTDPDRQPDRDSSPYEWPLGDEDDPDVPADDGEPYTITLGCGCVIDLDDEAMVQPCAEHAPRPF